MSLKAEQKQVDRITGQVLDLMSLEKSKKKPPIFENFIQIPPSGALVITDLPVRPQCLRSLFVCLASVTWNNLFQMTPHKLNVHASIHRKHYSEVMTALIDVGAIAKVSNDKDCNNYWLNPQIGWKGSPEYFWTVDSKFKTVITASSRLVPGGEQMQMSLNKLGAEKHA